MKRMLLLGAALAVIPLDAIARSRRAPPPTTPKIPHERETRRGEGRARSPRSAAADSGGDLARSPRIELLIAGRTRCGPVPGERSGHTRPEIWSNPPAHRGVERFRTATRALAAPAAAGDRPAFLTAWTAVRAACGGCHADFKSD